MRSPDYYLRPNVLLEPLVDRWYAWPHLIPPATAARNISERHLRIMESYINAPEAHAAAVKNRKLLGGPFMEYRLDARRRGQEAARPDQGRACAPPLPFPGDRRPGRPAPERRHPAIRWRPFTSESPSRLQGYVELVYDLNNQPSFRLLEPLLYRSRYYDRSMQSLMLSTIDHDERPFVLSTPRGWTTTAASSGSCPSRARSWIGCSTSGPGRRRFPAIKELSAHVLTTKDDLLLGLLTEEAPPTLFVVPTGTVRDGAISATRASCSRPTGSASCSTRC